MWFRNNQGKVNMSKTINMYLIIFSIILLVSILINIFTLNKISKNLNEIKDKVNVTATD